MRDYVDLVRRTCAFGTALFGVVALFWTPRSGVLLMNFPLLLLGCFAGALCISAFTANSWVTLISALAGTCTLVGLIASSVGADGWPRALVLVGAGLAVVAGLVPARAARKSD